jgi:hypothetical protein
LHFVVNGSSTDVLDAYKTAFEGKGWVVTVVSSGYVLGVRVSLAVSRSAASAANTSSTLTAGGDM